MPQIADKYRFARNGRPGIRRNLHFSNREARELVFAARDLIQRRYHLRTAQQRVAAFVHRSRTGMRIASSQLDDCPATTHDVCDDANLFGARLEYRALLDVRFATATKRPATCLPL